eukprot:6676521-Ditylum_brightwellii.AAC.1
MDQICVSFKVTGLTANLSKSTLFQKALEFVNFWLEPNRYCSVALKIQGVQDLQSPTSCKEVCILNDIINFIKNYIQCRAAVVEPIKQLISGKIPFIGEEEQEQAFQEIK